MPLNLPPEDDEEFERSLAADIDWFLRGIEVAMCHLDKVRDVLSEIYVQNENHDLPQGFFYDRVENVRRRMDEAYSILAAIHADVLDVDCDSRTEIIDAINRIARPSK